MSNHSNKAVSQAADPSQNWVSKLADKRPVDGGKITFNSSVTDTCSRKTRNASPKVRCVTLLFAYSLGWSVHSRTQTNCETCRCPIFCCCLEQGCSKTGRGGVGEGERNV